jgi:hypothetical protein
MNEVNSNLKPINAFKTSRKGMPHYELPESIYFVTFSTANRIKLPDAAKDIVLAAFQFHNGKKYDLYSCVVMQEHVHSIFKPLIINNHTQAWRPVPPDESDPTEKPEAPTDYFSLAQITHSLKSYSANRI